MGRQHPEATTIPSWNGRHWQNLPLPDASGAPSTLTIFRPPSPVSDGQSRMQSMIDASTFPNGFGRPPLPAPFAEPPILPQAPPSAAGVSTSHLPAIMDGSVGPNTDGSTSAAAHNVDGACDVGRKSGVLLPRPRRHEEAGDSIGEENAL